MKNEAVLKISKWHHAPEHRFIPGQTYIVTGATLYKQHLFRSGRKLRFLHNVLVKLLPLRGWRLNAWSVFSNHYHWIAKAENRAIQLADLICEFHSRTSIWLNRQDSTPGRQVWFNYWDRCLTFEKSYYARLHYVNQNPVRHGLVGAATDYPFCSARLYECETYAPLQRRLQTFKIDKVKVPDDFEPIWE